MDFWLDIGHARETGACGNGLEEHEVCARIAPLIQSLAAKEGHRAHILDFPHLDNRADINRTIAAANAKDYPFGISLHCDSSKSPAARGGHVCFVSAEGRRIARAIAAHLCALMPGRADQIVHHDDLAMLNRTRAPWALVEMLFLTNAENAAFVREHPEKIAAAVWAGIRDYITARLSS